MAEKRGQDISSNWVASGDLSAAQYRFVLPGMGHNQNDVFLAGSGSSVAPAGVLQNKPRHNEHAGVINHGWTKLQLASSMGQGAEIMAGVNGFPTVSGSGMWSCGILYSGGNSGEVGEAFINITRKSST